MNAFAPNRSTSSTELTSTRERFKMQMVLEERDQWEVVSVEMKVEQCVSQLDQTTFKRKSR
uniref:Uncharacterized protein n=1 Tax=Peronospora matthiolae TaxID=2874970 RepID=A0AAV1V8E3_9STRA